MYFGVCYVVGSRRKRGVPMPDIDLDLWVLVHGGFAAMETWPTSYRWAATRTVLRVLREALRTMPLHSGAARAWAQRLAHELDDTLALAPSLDEAFRLARFDPTDNPMVRVMEVFDALCSADEQAYGDLDFWYVVGEPSLTVFEIVRFLDNAAAWVGGDTHPPERHDALLPITGYGLPEGRFEAVFADEVGRLGHV